MGEVTPVLGEGMTSLLDDQAKKRRRIAWLSFLPSRIVAFEGKAPILFGYCLSFFIVGVGDFLKTTYVFISSLRQYIIDRVL